MCHTNNLKRKNITLAKKFLGRDPPEVRYVPGTLSQKNANNFNGNSKINEFNVTHVFFMDRFFPT